jgi:hypothetical protein
MLEEAVRPGDGGALGRVALKAQADGLKQRRLEGLGEGDRVALVGDAPQLLDELQVRKRRAVMRHLSTTTPSHKPLRGENNGHRRHTLRLLA